MTQAIESLGDEYRRDGYYVIVNPQPEQLPVFARDSLVDLFAQKNREIVLLRMGQDHGLLKATDEGLSYVGSLVMEAEQLLQSKSPRAALAIAWAAVEAAGRELLRQAHAEPPRSSVREMIQALITIGRLPPTEANNLMISMNLRNMVVHGIRPDDIPPEVVVFLIDLARRLVRTAPDQARATELALVTIIGDRLKAERPITGMVDRPNVLLRDL
jgi:hypothetical protein